MSAERRRALFHWRTGEVVRYAKDPSRPYRIEAQHYSHYASGREVIAYELWRVGDLHQTLTIRVMPEDLGAWRWATTTEDALCELPSP